VANGLFQEMKKRNEKTKKKKKEQTKQRKIGTNNK